MSQWVQAKGTVVRGKHPNSYPEEAPSMLTHRPHWGLKEIVLQVQEQSFHRALANRVLRYAKEACPKDSRKVAAKSELTPGFPTLDSTSTSLMGGCGCKVLPWPWAQVRGGKTSRRSCQESRKL